MKRSGICHVGDMMDRWLWSYGLDSTMELTCVTKMTFLCSGVGKTEPVILPCDEHDMDC